MSTVINRLLMKLGLVLSTRKHYQQLLNTANLARSRAILLKADEKQLPELARFLPFSKSQFGQDLFVVSETAFKKGGYFVEVGAADGIRLSNTYLLEHEFGWQGILAEPAHRWHKALRENRSCEIDTRCVWQKSGETLEFRESTDPEFSTIEDFAGQDLHKARRRDGVTYPVATVSLMDLLQQHDAPREIDYLSVDTEGSEFEILSGMDFNRYCFGVITCEHNHGPQRKMIHSLLSAHGYIRKYEDISQVDDWYVRRQ